MREKGVWVNDERQNTHPFKRLVCPLAAEYFKGKSISKWIELYGGTYRHTDTHTHTHTLQKLIISVSWL